MNLRGLIALSVLGTGLIVGAVVFDCPFLVVLGVGASILTTTRPKSRWLSG